MPTGQAGGAPSDALTAAIACGECEQWNLPHAPVRIHGDTWYVGVDGLSSILIRTGAGLVLLDGDLPQSVPLIEANIRSLGLDVRDVRLILVSHEHFDHVGGVAALQRDSGAKVLGGAAAVRALQAGQPTAEDPQFHSRPNAFPIPAAGMRAVQDGETIAIGGLAITAHRTPGHTPGSTSWTWRSCERGDCREIVYADSLAAISSAGFRYTGDAGRADTTIAFRDSIARIGALPCDILLTPHPSASDFWERVAARSRKSPVDPLVDRQACKEYAARALRGLEERIAEESAAGARKAGAGSR
jgi:metallo-beta-lactamase class B